MALYSHATPTWTTEGEFADREITAPSGTNVWICELGNATESGSFGRFVDGVLGAAIEVVDGTEVRYGSPSRGTITFGWDAPLKVGETEIPLDDYPRWENPYLQADFNSRQFHIEYNGQTLDLGFTDATRQAGP